jgi:hypothetical protein
MAKQGSTFLWFFVNVNPLKLFFLVYLQRLSCLEQENKNLQVVLEQRATTIADLLIELETFKIGAHKFEKVAFPQFFFGLEG